MQIQLVVGDWSDDGHGKTDTVTFETNATSTKEVEEAYQRGVKLVGVDITEHCEEYEDNSIPAEVIESLNGAGFDLNTLDDYKYMSKEGRYWLYSEGYALIYAFLCEKGGISMTKVKDSPIINIGGYGLFN